VTSQEGRRFAEENSLSFFVETSALDGQNIDKVFLIIDREKLTFSRLFQKQQK